MIVVMEDQFPAQVMCVKEVNLEENGLNVILKKPGAKFLSYKF